jgi:hypothetical protein
MGFDDDVLEDAATPDVFRDLCLFDRAIAAAGRSEFATGTMCAIGFDSRWRGAMRPRTFPDDQRSAPVPLSRIGTE